MKMTICKYLVIFVILFYSYSCGKSGNFNIEGTIKSKEYGKDGYAANIVGIDGKMYSAVISRVNMDGTFEYEDLKIGDHVKVYGDSMILGDRISIIVTRIRRK